jgi:hypothetical protein
MNNTRSQIIRAPDRQPFKYAHSIFLAGSTARTDEPDWRETLKAALAHLPVTIIDPVRTDWDSSWREDISFPPFREQTEWELDLQDQADIVVFFFHPRTPAPVSMLELGLCARSGRAVVGCPPGYWKKGNVDTVATRLGLKLVEDKEDLVEAVRERLRENGLT